MRIALLALAGGLVFAQDSESLRQCMDRVTTQNAMNICAYEEAERTEKQRVAAFEELLTAARSKQGAVEKIRLAEKAWLAYRDAVLEAMYPAADKQSAYGSVYPMNAALMRAEITRTWIETLRSLRNRYQG